MACPDWLRRSAYFPCSCRCAHRPRRIRWPPLPAHFLPPSLLSDLLAPVIIQLVMSLMEMITLLARNLFWPPPFCLSLPHPLSLCLTHTCTFCLTLSHTHKYTCTHLHTLSHSLSHTHFLFSLLFLTLPPLPPSFLSSFLLWFWGCYGNGDCDDSEVVMVMMMVMEVWKWCGKPFIGFSVCNWMSLKCWGLLMTGNRV